MDGKNPTLTLFTYDGFALLIEERRKGFVKSIMIPCFHKVQLFKHTTLDLAIANLCRQIEADILSLLIITTGDHNDDGFISDTERMIAANAVVCNKILQTWIKYPSSMLISLFKWPWL